MGLGLVRFGWVLGCCLLDFVVFAVVFALIKQPVAMFHRLALRFAPGPLTGLILSLCFVTVVACDTYTWLETSQFSFFLSYLCSNFLESGFCACDVCFPVVGSLSALAFVVINGRRACYARLCER